MRAGRRPGRNFSEAAVVVGGPGLPVHLKEFGLVVRRRDVGDLSVGNGGEQGLQNSLGVPGGAASFERAGPMGVLGLGRGLHQRAAASLLQACGERAQRVASVGLRAGRDGPFDGCLDFSWHGVAVLGQYTLASLDVNQALSVMRQLLLGAAVDLARRAVVVSEKGLSAPWHLEDGRGPRERVDSGGGFESAGLSCRLPGCARSPVLSSSSEASASEETKGGTSSFASRISSCSVSSLSLSSLAFLAARTAAGRGALRLRSDSFVLTFRILLDGAAGSGSSWLGEARNQVRVRPGGGVSDEGAVSTSIWGWSLSISTLVGFFGVLRPDMD